MLTVCSSKVAILLAHPKLKSTTAFAGTFGALKAAQHRTMVTLRARQTAGSVVSAMAPPPLPQHSIARSFGGARKASTGTVASRDGKGKTKAVADAAAETAAPTNGHASKRRKGEANGTRTTTTDDTAPEKKVKSPTTTKKASAAKVEEEAAAPLPLLSREEVKRATTIDYPRLPFDLPQAIAHLAAADDRFNALLDVVELKPYEELVEGRVRELDLFRTLATSILGQQVSWLAARAIVYRFIRLFHPDLPEKPDYEGTPRESWPFPDPIDVSQTDDAVLRSAGLSGAKVKYVKDVATRFSDGRLDARKIITLDEEACIAELVQIKGVGRWTAEMLLMFALRRGNILPVGDLGVQKGMVIFFTSKRDELKIGEKKRKQQKGVKKEDAHDADEKVPVVEEHLTASQVEVERAVEPSVSAIDGHHVKREHETGPHVDAPPHQAPQRALPPLPEGITASLLKTRRDGKKAKGNVYLTAPEMEALAAPWAPFRSLGVYMMWALVD